PRWPRRGLHLASALFGGGTAVPEGVAMGRILFLAFAAAFWLSPAAPLHAQPAISLPQGEGRDLVAVACTQCHALAPIIAGREGTAGWRRHVHNMVLRGAQLNASEAETVIRYLSTNFGPGMQAAASVAL